MTPEQIIENGDLSHQEITFKMFLQDKKLNLAFGDPKNLAILQLHNFQF